LIRFMAMVTLGVPATIWYATRIAWAVYRKADNAACVCAEVPRTWARLLLRVAGVSIEVEAAENIDPTAPQVVVANHSSWFDPLVLAGFCPGPYVFVAKKEVARVPFFGMALRACGHIYIDRSDRDLAVESLEVARERLEDDGPSIIMFPEGTRSATGELQRFKKGTFVLAIQAGAEVVPAALIGARDVMKKNDLLVHPGVIRLRFGTPIPVDSYDFEQRDELADRAWLSLRDLLSAATPT
jgi:1-acyl-sn-glycerol-3-phosphate acyltransferase